MIGYIRGRIERCLDKKGIILDVNGVGYEIQMPPSMVSRLDVTSDELTVYTHLSWKEDSVSLYGFEHIEERDMFRMLIDVSGIGPRMALNILSTLSVQRLLDTIASGDATRLQAIHGIGKKTAARICVDLKEKANALTRHYGGTLETRDTAHGKSCLEEDAMSALLNLGYRRSEVNVALEKARAGLGEEAGLEVLIKSALGILSKGRSRT